MGWSVVALIAVAILCALVLVAVRRWVRRRHTDFMLHDGGTYLFVRPMNHAAVSWVDEHLGRYKDVGPAAVIDYGDADDIILSIRADGLTI